MAIYGGTRLKIFKIILTKMFKRVFCKEKTMISLALMQDCKIWGSDICLAKLSSVRCPEKPACQIFGPITYPISSPFLKSFLVYFCVQLH